MSATIAVGFFALWLLESGLQAGPAPSPPLLPEPDSVRWARLPKPEFVEGILANGLHTHRDTVEKHQRFTDLLQGYYVSPVVWQQLNQLDRNTFDFRKVTAGKKYTVLYQPDSLRALHALVYEPNEVEYVIFHFDDSLRVEPCARQIQVAEKSVSGVIVSTLAESLSEQGLSPELTNRFVDVFAWQVDFYHLQKNDRYKLIYEEEQVEGRTIGIRGITGIYFEQNNTRYYAFAFDQGNGIDYFDEQGKSLRKAFLKYPIEFTRISSRFSKKRFHPIAKVFKPHLGTDLSAPPGTPIRSVGDGVVLEARYNSRSGRYVKVKHNDTYTTGYLHMSRIASSIKPGIRVKQGQVIGFVGSTGWATGPHLCYRFYRQGVQVDALKVKLPPAEPIAEVNRPEFDSLRQVIIRKLDRLSFSAGHDLAGN